MRKKIGRAILDLVLIAGLVAACTAGAASVGAEETWAGEEYDSDWDEDEYEFEEDEDEGSAEGVPGGVHLGPSTEELSETTGRDIDAIISRLRDLPDDYEGLRDAGVIIGGSDGVANFGKWAAFVQSAAAGNPASVDVATFTSEGQAVIDHVDFNGSNFVCVRDNSRDRYYLGSAYIVRTYKYVIGFAESGRTVLIAPQDAGGSTGDSVDAEASWQAAALAAVPYESLAALEDGIDEDATGETTPVICSIK